MLVTVVIMLIALMSQYEIDAANNQKSDHTSKSMLSVSSQLANICVGVIVNSPGNVTLNECSPVEVKPSCTIKPGVLKLPYPDCCPKSSCPSETAGVAPTIQLTQNEMVQKGILNLFANELLNLNSEGKTSSKGSSSSNSSSIFLVV